MKITSRNHKLALVFTINGVVVAFVASIIELLETALRAKQIVSLVFSATASASVVP
jgi:hypothetical protein